MVNNPFKPFYPLTRLETKVSTWDNLYAILEQNLFSEQNKTIILSGPAGAGKSSFAGAYLSSQLARKGVRTVNLTPSFYLDPDSDIHSIAAQLNLETNTLDNILRATGFRTQGVGDIQDSEAIKVFQVNANSSLNSPTPSLSSQILALPKATSQKICFVLDQFETYFLQRKKSNLSLFKAIANSSSSHKGDVSCVLIVKDSFMKNCFQVLNSECISHCACLYLDGINADDAITYAENAFSKHGVSVSLSVLKESISKCTIEGQVWPVALQAELEKIYDVEKSRACHEEQLKGDKIDESPLAFAVKKRLLSIGRSGYQDSLFILSRIAQLSFISGPQTLQQIFSDLNAFTEDDLEVHILSLCELGLLEEEVGKKYIPRHDSILNAIIELRTQTSEGVQLQKIDELVKRWISNEISEGVDLLLSYYLKRDFAPIPTPHFSCLASNYFITRSAHSGMCEDYIKEIASHIDSSSVLSLLKKRSQILGYAGYLKPEDIYTLLLINDSFSVSTAVDELILSYNSTAAVWSSSGMSRAFMYADPSRLLESLMSLHVEDIPQDVIELITRVLLHNTHYLSLADKVDLWAESIVDKYPLCSMELFRHALSASDKSIRIAEIQLDSKDTDVALLALRALSQYDLKRYSKEIISFLNATDIAKRRGAYYCLPDNIEKNIFDIELLFESEDSSFVREAMLENIVKFDNVLSKKIVLMGIDDDVEYVRESAVYASTHVFEREELYNITKQMFNDPSFLVREALLHVIDRNSFSVPSELILRDIKNGPDTLKKTAIHLSNSAQTPETSLALADIIVSYDVASGVRISALRAAQALKEEAFVKPVCSLLSHSENIEEISEAILLLESIPCEDSEFVLCRLAQHTSLSVRERAIYSLARFPGDSVNSVLLNAVLDVSPSVQARAIYGLGRRKCYEAVPLVKKLSVPTDELRTAIKWYTEEARIKGAKKY